MGMARNPKRPKDPNQLAKFVIDAAAGDKPETMVKESAMVELGRRGGVVGGVARAASLAPEQRSDIARAAARRRWGKADDGSSGEAE